jgi:citrate synthase
MTRQYELKDLATGKTALLEAVPGTIGPEVLNIAHLTKDLGVFTFDPGFIATASTESKITYIDGDAGILLYRGYPVEQLAERSSFLEVADLLIHGELPSDRELGAFRDSVMRHGAVNGQILQIFRGFQQSAHPMAMVSAVAAYYHATTDINNPVHRELFARRILAKLPTIAAAAYRHSIGASFIPPRRELDYCENLLHLMFGSSADIGNADPVAAEALELLFILHADHEQNASTSTVRLAGSTGANPYAAISAGISALWGPAHGGANEAVLDMLEQIGSVDRIDDFLARVKDKSGHVRLMGFGHRVYKNFDPRARIIRDMCHRVLAKLGRTHDPLFELALKLEEIALKDDYFVSRKLYPNVDFYSGIIYSALGIPRSMFTVMFAIARTAGWVAHWREMVSDPQMKIGRPRQLYTGPARQDYPMRSSEVGAARRIADAEPWHANAPVSSTATHALDAVLTP